MGREILSEMGTQIFIPVCAVIGIAFSLLQWILVSFVKLSPDKSCDGKKEPLIEEEEGGNDHSVIIRCAEIQNAISEGALLFFHLDSCHLLSILYMFIYFRVHLYLLICVYFKI